MTTKKKVLRSPSAKARRTRSALESSLKQVVARIDQLDESVKTLARSGQVVWNNQKELSKSETLLDEQFAVSTRMMIMSVNYILEKMGDEERIDEKDVAQMFRDWASFRERPDYRKFMMEWFLGVPLDKLPPPPEVKEGEEDAEGSQGDEAVAEGQSEDSAIGQADTMP